MLNFSSFFISAIFLLSVQWHSIASITVTLIVDDNPLQSAILCPNNTPLHYMFANFSNSGKAMSIEIVCLDAETSMGYIQCKENSVPSLLQQQYNTEQFSTVCNYDCFMSGIQLVNGSIASFTCSTFNTSFHITSCSWASKRSFSTIGDESLSRNTFISEVGGTVSFSIFRFITWKYRYCSFMKIGSTLFCEIEEPSNLNIEQFHAIRQPTNTWTMHCGNGHQLIGINPIINCTNNTEMLYTVQNYCKDCCAPLDFSSVVMTTCNYYNYTELHCPHGTYLHGSINNNNNDIYCSGLLTDEELLVFYCEECDKVIPYCSSCIKDNKGYVLCTSCSHPNGYRMRLTKNRNKCKIIATVTSLYTIRTIWTWIIHCDSTGSPKVQTELYINEELRASSTIKRHLEYTEHISVYGVVTVKCVAKNAWGNDSMTIYLAIQPLIVDDTQPMFVTSKDSSVLMNCVLHGDYDTWGWYHEDQLLPNNTIYTYYMNTSLVINYITADVEGTYTCIAKGPPNVVKSVVKTLLYIESVFQPVDYHSIVLVSDTVFTSDGLPTSLTAGLSIVIASTGTPTTPTDPSLSPSDTILLHLAVVYSIFITSTFIICLFKIISKYWL